MHGKVLQSTRWLWAVLQQFSGRSEWAAQRQSFLFLRLLELDFAYFLMLFSATISVSTKVHNGAP